MGQAIRMHLKGIANLIKFKSELGNIIFFLCGWLLFRQGYDFHDSVDNMNIFRLRSFASVHEIVVFRNQNGV